MAEYPLFCGACTFIFLLVDLISGSPGCWGRSLIPDGVAQGTKVLHSSLLCSAFSVVVVSLKFILYPTTLMSTWYRKCQS